MSSDPSKDNSLKRARSPSSSSSEEGDHKRLRENHTEPVIINGNRSTSATSDNFANQGTSSTSDNFANQGTSATSDNLANQGPAATTDNINKQGTTAASNNGPHRRENPEHQLAIARHPFSIVNLLRVSQTNNDVSPNQARNSTESSGQHVNHSFSRNPTNNYRFPSNFHGGSASNFSGFQQMSFPTMRPVHPQQLTSALNSLHANQANLHQRIPIPPATTFDWSNLHMPLHRPQPIRPQVPHLAPTQMHRQIPGYIPPEEIPILTRPMNANAPELDDPLARTRVQQSKCLLELAHQNFLREIPRICQGTTDNVVSLASRDYLTLVNQLERNRQAALRVSNEPLVHLLHDQQRLEAIKKTRDRLLALKASQQQRSQQSNSTSASLTLRPATAEPSNSGPSTAGPSNAWPSTAGPSNGEPSSTTGPSNAGPSTAGPSNAGPSTTGPSTERSSTSGSSTSEQEPATSSSNQRPTKARRYSQQVQDILFDWYMRHIDDPYISDADIAAIAEQSGLTGEQVRRWLRNRRHREKTGRKK